LPGVRFQALGFSCGFNAFWNDLEIRPTPLGCGLDLIRILEKGDFFQDETTMLETMRYPRFLISECEESGETFAL
jgi:hypothetical protein